MHRSAQISCACISQTNSQCKNAGTNAVTSDSFEKYVADVTSSLLLKISQIVLPAERYRITGSSYRVLDALPNTDA